MLASRVLARSEEAKRKIVCLHAQFIEGRSPSVDQLSYFSFQPLLSVELTYAILCKVMMEFRRRKEMFYLTTHSTHFIYQIAREEIRCCQWATLSD